jgi:hypothetical protein
MNHKVYEACIKLWIPWDLHMSKEMWDTKRRNILQTHIFLEALNHSKTHIY